MPENNLNAFPSVPEIDNHVQSPAFRQSLSRPIHPPPTPPPTLSGRFTPRPPTPPPNFTPPPPPTPPPGHQRHQPSPLQKQKLPRVIQGGVGLIQNFLSFLLLGS